MKSDFRPRTSGLGCYLIAIVGVWFVVPDAQALNAENPYGPIVSRNVFGLKPPTVAPLPTLTPVAAAITFKLQGISTILDRKQVLLKVKTAARPPEPAKEQSYLWGEGQGEDDIEVLAIDAVAGTVKLKNHGEPVALTMKDDAERPAAGAALPLPGSVVPNLQSPKLPGVNVPAANANPAHQAPPGATLPGAVPAPGGVGRTIPTRSLRTSATDNARLGVGTSTPNGDNALPYDAQMALIEIQRERTKEAVQAGKLPPLPPIAFPQK